MSELVTFGETAVHLSPRGHERLASARETTLHADGVESNVAVTAGCLGTRATWLSKLPDTALGRRVVSLLESHGIETQVTWTDEGRQGLVFQEAGAQPRETGRWHDRENTAVSTAEPADLPMDRVQNADVVFAGTATSAVSEAATNTVEAMLRAGSGAGGLTALDVDYEPGRGRPARHRAVAEHLFDHVDVLLVREDRAGTVLGRSGSPREVANGLVADYDLEMVVVSGAEGGGVVIHDAPGTAVAHERDGIATETVDPTGGHDAFVGGFLQRLAAGADAAEALTYGVAAGALARTVPGPTLVADRAELDEVADRVRQTRG